MGRGRPRNYDPDAALDAALAEFWARGFSRTSLDDLSRATGMKRPSLYAAFGDKKAIYLRATERFRQRMRETYTRALTSSADPTTALRALLHAALDVYLANDGQGCMAVSTTAVESLAEDAMRADLRVSIGQLEEGFAVWLRAQVERGTVRADTDASMVAWQLTSTIFALGIHARAGADAAPLRTRCDQLAESLLRPWLA